MKRFYSLFLALLIIASLGRSPGRACFSAPQLSSEPDECVFFSLEDMSLNSDGEYELIIPLSLYSNEELPIDDGISNTGDFDVYLRVSYGPSVKELVTTVYVKRFNGLGVVKSATATFSYTIFDQNSGRLSSGTSQEILKDLQSFANVSVTHVFKNVNYDMENNYISVSAKGYVSAIGSSTGGYYLVSGSNKP